MFWIADAAATKASRGVVALRGIFLMTISLGNNVLEDTVAETYRTVQCYKSIRQKYRDHRGRRVEKAQKDRKPRVFGGMLSSATFTLT